MRKQVIICVDDESIVLNSLEMQLRRLLGDGFLLEFADNAHEALELIEELVKNGNDVPLIISDWLMPGMKGDELLSKIHVRYPKMKKALLTGQADSSAMAKVLHMQGVVLHKPWKQGDLQGLFTKFQIMLPAVA